MARKGHGTERCKFQDLSRSHPSPEVPPVKTGFARRLGASMAFIALSLPFVVPAHAMNQVRSLTYTDAATSTFGVSGAGVITAVLDRGIDWKNMDFRNDDGSSRIAYIFDLSDDTGAHAAGNTYGMGTIYTRQQIDAALQSSSALATRDAVGHGTTSTGILSGSGRNLQNRKYRGIAPESTIISIKITGGAPAHDDQPEEPHFYDAARIPVAIDFARDKAQELGMPCVMLLNIGSPGGPTDGTSALCRKIDSTVGPGKPGIVFVTGPGDAGGAPNRVGGTVAQGGTVAVQVQKGTSGVLTCDFWYGGSDRLDVTIDAPSGTFGPYASPATNDDSAFEHAAEFDLDHRGSNVDGYDAANDRRELTVFLTGPAGNYTINLNGANVTDGHFDGTLNPSYSHGDTTGNKFLSFVVPGSIWDAATARNNICPGDYVFRTQWTDVDGNPESHTGEGNPGQIWTGSSTGPTFDGRIGLDVCAPGDTLFTTYNPTSYFATFRSNLVQDGGGFYGAANAVSAAAPTVAGIVALMLQANPQLDASQVKSLLHRTARTDRFARNLPNEVWGYGKVDAFGAVALSLTGSAPTVNSAKINITKGSIAIKGSGFSSSVSVYLDGISFTARPKIKNGEKVTQKGTLSNGMTIDQYVHSGAQAAVVVRNDGAGAAEFFFTRP